MTTKEMVGSAFLYVQTEINLACFVNGQMLLKLPNQHVSMA